MRKPPYHIAFILTSFARGGMEMRLADVVNGLDKTRWNPHVYAFYDHVTLQGAIEPHRLHTPLAKIRRDPSLPLTLAQIFRREQTAIAWALTQGLAAGLGRLGAVLGGVPVRILSLHDVFPIAPLTRALNPITDVVVVNSQYAQNHAIRGGIPAEKICVLVNGIDTERYSLGEDQREKLLRIPKTRPVILQVGRLEPAIKGQDLLLHAIAPLMQGDNPPLLVLVGEGIFTQRDELEKLAQDLGIRAHVNFIGIRDDVPNLMRSADLLVMSSRTESSPNVLLEAQACGLPVVATQVGGAPELLQDGITGRLIPPDDEVALTQAIAFFLEDALQRQTFGKAGRKLVRDKFSIQMMLQGRIELFEEWLDRKRI